MAGDRALVAPCGRFDAAGAPVLPFLQGLGLSELDVTLHSGQQKRFRAHDSCYINPFGASPGICNTARAGLAAQRSSRNYSNLYISKLCHRHAHERLS